MGKKLMYCPYLVREIELNKKRIGIKCECGEIKFYLPELRRFWVYGYCGSMRKYEECPLYKEFTKKAGGNPPCQ